MPGTVSGAAQGPPSAQGPFARTGRYPMRRGIHAAWVDVAPPSPLLRTHAPDHIPLAAYDHGSRSASLRRLRPAPAGKWPFPTLSLQVLLWMPGPMPRRVFEVHLPVTSLDDIGLPQQGIGRLSRENPLSDFRAGMISQLQAFRNVLASRFACHPGRSHRCGQAAGQPWRFHPSRTCVVTFARFGYASRPNRAIDGWGLSPHKTRSLVGCSPLPHSSVFGRDIGHDGHCSYPCSPWNPWSSSSSLLRVLSVLRGEIYPWRASCSAAMRSRKACLAGSGW